MNRLVIQEAAVIYAREEQWLEHSDIIENVMCAQWPVPLHLFIEVIRSKRDLKHNTEYKVRKDRISKLAI